MVQGIITNHGDVSVANPCSREIFQISIQGCAETLLICGVLRTNAKLVIFFHFANIIINRGHPVAYIVVCTINDLWRGTVHIRLMPIVHAVSTRQY